MNRFFTFLLLILLGFSCAKEHHPRNFDTLTLKEFKVEDTSIRSILALQENKVAYAGSKGQFGVLEDGIFTFKKKFFQDSIHPYFRSIATNKKDVFVLSIGNPALLYKIDKNKQTKLVYKENHEKVFYDSMQFFDSQNGIAIGDPTQDCLSILITNDSGNTWSKVPCQKLPQTSDGEAAFAASNTNIKVLDKTAWVVTGGKKARVFKTTDLGETWQVFNTPIIQGKASQGIYSVDFADAFNGIIMGGDYAKPNKNKENLAITNDGGKTWKLIPDGYPNYKSCVQYVPNTQGKEVFAVGKTGIAFSNDGGHTWKHISDDSYYTIKFVDKNHAWLAGNQKVGKLNLSN